MPDADSYAWIHESLSDAACVTVTVRREVAAVLEAFGADTSMTVDVDEAFGDGDQSAFVSVKEIPGGVVAVELNGFQGSLPEVIARLSTGGLAASMFWNVNDDNAFTCARGGELIASVDMYDAEDPDEVDLPEELNDLFELAADEDADLHAIGMAMIEQFTGIPIPKTAVTSMREAHPILTV